MALTAARPTSNALKTTNGFWWTDLQTNDAAAAAEFYARVLGWSFQEFPMGDAPSDIYRMAHIDGVQLAGMGEFQPGTPAEARVPRWNNYIYVADVDATVADALKLGATLALPAMDVMDQGRMAVIIDPTGAPVSLWQPGTHTGADAVNQPSTYTWVELYSDDVESSKRFYGELLGWGWDQQETPGGEYWMATLHGRSFAGMMPKSDEMAQMPSMWLTYFGVADLDAAINEVKAANGNVIFGPMRMGPGNGAGITDPQGAMVVLFQMDEWPQD